MAKEKTSKTPAPAPDKEVKCVPNPLMCKEGKGVRNFACLSYDNCLDKAAKAMWSGFTCRDCGQYTQKEEE